MVDLNWQAYVDWDVGDVMFLKGRNNYAYRVTLIYADGKKKIRQKSGYKTKKEAQSAKNKTIADLVSGTYVVNDSVTVKEFLEYWLEADVRRKAGSSNTYDTYKNIVNRHIVPAIGRKKIKEINKGDVQRLYQREAAVSAASAKLVKTVLNVSFRYAASHGMVSVNIVKDIRLPKMDSKASYHTRNIDSSKTLSKEQMKLLIEKAKETPIYMQVLLNALCGLRRQEINVVRYSDIDYINRVMYIERQLGKGLKREGDESDEMEHTTKNPLPLKTASSKRALPIPDLVMEAIIEQRKVYERNRSRRRSRFRDLDYICCGAYGTPRSKDFHYKHWKKLLKDCGIPDIRWHDLRSSYCSLLIGSNNHFSPKAVSKLMGHSKEMITVDVYADSANVIPVEIPELEEYISEVISDDEDTNAQAEKTVIKTEEYFGDEEDVEAE